MTVSVVFTPLLPCQGCSGLENKRWWHRGCTTVMTWASNWLICEGCDHTVQMIIRSICPWSGMEVRILYWPVPGPWWCSWGCCRASLELCAAFCIPIALLVSAKWFLFLFGRVLFSQVEKSSRESGVVTAMRRVSKDGRFLGFHRMTLNRQPLPYCEF